MKKKSYQWLVDREQADADKGESKLEIVESGIELRLERFAFGQYAAVDMVYVDTKEPFKLVPMDSSHGASDHTISFQIALSGRALGKLPGLGECVLDSQWGIITDFSEGSAEFIVDSAEPARTMGGTLSVDQIQTLFSGDGFDSELEVITRRRGTLRSFLVTPAIRNIVSNALAAPLIGPLRRLYLEGAVLQLFALIFQNELSDPIQGDGVLAQEQAMIKAIELAHDLLIKQLANPPSLLELSRATGLSTRKLSNGFKERYRMNVVDYLADKRLQMAYELINDQPHYPLKALANDIGYNHVSNFTTAFKRKFGITPAAYVKSLTSAGNLPHLTIKKAAHHKK